MRFEGSGMDLENESVLPFTKEAYFELVDWTGRIVKDGKGFIPAEVPSIVKRMGLNSKHWVHSVTNFGCLG